ncbi:MAG TPA: porin family protein [Chitinophagaceae bacterium]|nr:porin family protein [Chitinophagaceae bacterium]
MKRIFLGACSALAACWYLPARSQSSALFLQGGLNLANISVTDNGRVDNSNTLASFQAGLTADFRLVPGLHLQPGLLFTGKGAKSQSGSTSDATYFRATTNPYYLEIPLDLVVKLPLGTGKFFAGAGPYLGIGVAGNNKVEGKYLGVGFQGDKPIRWSNDDPTTLNYEEGAGLGIMRRFDYGLHAKAGLEGKAVAVAVGYGLGMAKLQSGSNSGANDKNKNRVLSLTLAFRL